MHRLAFIATLGATLIVAAPSHAQRASGDVYQWKDASGVTHYSESPPPKGTYQQRRISHGRATAAVATTGPDEAPATANPRCAVARKNVSALDSDRPVGHDEDGDGKPDANLSEDQRAAQRALAQAEITAYCSP